ncbi:MAG: hypothetical protein DRI26_08170 [Chloroflexi bacterium]|nr:MAG: hypothetical protein DRI26_08170 [Chloroflexota bacterium]
MRVKRYGYDEYLIWDLKELRQMGLSPQEARKLKRELDTMRRNELRRWRRIREHEVVGLEIDVLQG